ncbi:tetratricopeptide repeat protein [Flavobacterium sp. '19STA2R22 D10 B1']|uniref:ATP-binding protein n=1 Tax=Flavobacterium aerium TaxID=3037261 RepID=UPI00278C4391|nr:tetratricopeptide repeat protein [Flavobacterium sp. '19STA2R22 D10 B1']
MVTIKKKYKLLFFIIIIGAFISCNQPKESIIGQQDVINQVNKYLTLSQEDSLSIQKRLDNSTKAYKMAYASNQDSLVLKTLWNVVTLRTQNTTDSTWYYIHKFENYAIKKNDTLYKAKAYEELGNYYWKKEKLDSTFYFYNISKLQYELRKDSLQVVYKLLLMARIQQTSNDYFGSENTATEALKFLKNSTNKQYYREAYNILGVAYKNLMSYDKALDYYQKAYELTEDSLSKIILKNNQAVVYIKKKAPMQAIPILSSLIQIPIEIKDEKLKTEVFKLKGRVLNNLGTAYFDLGDRKLSLFYFERGLMIREQINNSYELISSYMNLSRYYYPKDLILAKKYASKAYEFATKNNSVDDRIEALHLLIQDSSGSELKELALYNNNLRDSIGKVRMKVKDEFASVKFDSSKSKEENLKLKADQAIRAIQVERISNQKNLYGLGGLSALLICGLLIYILKSIHKRQMVQETYKTETRISKKVHDELANDVHNAMAFAENQDLSSPENKERLMNTLDQVYIRTRDISRENSSIDTGAKYGEHLKQLLSEYSTNQSNVIIRGLDAIDWKGIQENKKIIVFRILQELMVNMKKHSEASLIVVGFLSNVKKLNITYSDNGIGMESNAAVYKSGLKNIEERIHTIGGKVIFETGTGKGFKANFEIPY